MSSISQIARAHTLPTTTRQICCGTSMSWESDERAKSMPMKFWSVSKRLSNILKLRKFELVGS